MKKPGWISTWAIVLFISACVTINVYFPEAEVEQAAGEFIEKVIGEDTTTPDTKNDKPMGFSIDLAVISTAHAAAADINIATPAIQAIQKRMADRFNNVLKQHFDSGALGFTHNGLIELRDASVIALPDRAAIKQAVAEENRDRSAVYREIAIANQHPEWEADIRNTFAAQWIEKARKGWFYQNAEGAWLQK